MKRKKQGFITSHWILCVLLLLATFLPQVAFAVESSSAPVVTQTIKPAEKVSAKVKDSFSKKDRVTFLVKLTDQIDTPKVAAEAEKKAKALKHTPAKTELMKRSAVVSHLRNKADETQQNLISYLQEQKQKGNVTDFESFYIVNAMAITATEDVMNEIAAFTEVAKVLPNETRQLITPDATETEAEPIADINGIEWSVQKVGAPALWEQGIDGGGIVIASLDTGVKWDHPALKEHYLGYDPANPDTVNHEMNWFDAVSGITTPYDDQGHGTHTIGTMVGATPDGTEKIGVAPGAKFIAVKAFRPGIGATDVDLLEAGEWILAPKDATGTPHPEKAPDIVNNSWGGGAGLDEFYRPMVQSWRAADIFPVFSAGNTGPVGTVTTPANYPESFAVAAIDVNDRLAGFSSRGPGPFKDELKPNIAAPGVGVRSSMPNGAYGTMSGTSMAAPHVSGVIALLQQVAPQMTVDQIEEVLMHTTRPMTDTVYTTSPNLGYGHGLVNAGKAIESYKNGLGTVKGMIVNEEDGTPVFKASVTALEINRAAVTKADGSYGLYVPVGTYTLKVEAYGYYPTTQTVEVTKDGTVVGNMSLKPLPRGTFKGKLLNSQTKQPIANATLSLIEDPAVLPVKTDNEGNYSITAIEGTYTLHMATARYKLKEQSITFAGIQTVNLEMDPFVGFPGEIKYDDGTSELGSSWGVSGSGFAMKVSLPEGQTSGMLSKALVHFFKNSFTAVGQNYEVAVFSANSYGVPDKKIAGPVSAKVTQVGDWNEVDLSDLGITLTGDFYLVYLQTEGGNTTPYVSFDGDGINYNRSWVYNGGIFSQTSARMLGNVMMRAVVDFEAGPPTISNPADGSFTNQSTITVDGQGAISNQINIFNGTEKVAAGSINGEGHYGVQVPLRLGENTLTATVSNSVGSTGSSAPVKVILDQTKPTLKVTSPSNLNKKYGNSVVVEGTAADAYLDHVLVNGKEASLNEDGTFAYAALLKNGSNLLKIEAIDKAGNVAVQEITVKSR